MGRPTRFSQTGMARKIKLTTHSDVRDKISASMLLVRLQNHALGRLKKPMDASQVSAAQILLRKILPDQESLHPVQDFVFLPVVFLFGDERSILQALELFQLRHIVGFQCRSFYLLRHLLLCPVHGHDRIPTRRHALSEDLALLRLVQFIRDGRTDKGHAQQEVSSLPAGGASCELSLILTNQDVQLVLVSRFARWRNGVLG